MQDSAPVSRMVGSAQELPPQRNPARQATVERNASRASGIQSLRRAFSILEYVARAPQGISVTELSSLVQLHLSTTSHLLRTLVQLDYVSQDDATRLYYAGTRLFAVASMAATQTAMIRIAMPILEKLAKDTGESTHLAILSRDEVIIIARAVRDGMLQLSDRNGTVRPLHCTALGKILAGALTADTIRTIADTHPFVRYTPTTEIDAEAFIRQVRAASQRGFAFDDAEYDHEVRCVAVPVFNFTGRMIAAIGFSGPIWRISLVEVQPKIELLIEAGRRLSAQLGFGVTGEHSADSVSN